MADAHPDARPSQTLGGQGSTIIKRSMVAKSVRVMTRGTPTIWEFRKVAAEYNAANVGGGGTGHGLAQAVERRR